MVNRTATSTEIATADYNLGFIAELQNNWETAEQKYQLAIEKLGPESRDAYVTYMALGRIQLQAGESEAADETFRQAYMLNPTVPWALLELAQLHQQARATAEPFLTAAREVAPNQAYVDIVTAQICVARKEFDCAEKAYQRALEKRPNSGWLYGRIGDFYRPEGEPLPHQSWAKAADYYAQAVQRRPNDPWAHERLAFALYYQGDYVTAAEHFAISLHDLSHPQSQLAERYCNLAQVHLAAGSPNEALANAQICREKLTNPEQSASVDALIDQIRSSQKP